MKHHKWTSGIIFFSAGLALALLLSGLVRAQAEAPLAQAAPSVDAGTAFTFQGRLAQNGVAVNGNCDLQFLLYDAATLGSQVGSPVTLLNEPVAGGLVTVSLDFGAAAFDGQARWLEIHVRCPAGGGSYTTLTPRQELTPTAMAHTLRPGAVISGTAPAGALTLVNSQGHGLEIGSAALAGVRVGSAGLSGLFVNAAGASGLGVVSAGGNGVDVTHAAGDGFFVCATGSETCTANSFGNNGLEIGNAETHGIRVAYTGLDGMAVISPTRHGAYVDQAGAAGLYVNHAGDDGLFVCSTGSQSGCTPTGLDNGVEIGNAENNGVLVGSAGSSGVLVGSAALSGLHVNHTDGDGLFVCATGSETTCTPSITNNGLEVGNAENYGVYVGSARNGVYVGSAGNSGVWVSSADEDGVHVNNAGDFGLYVDSAGIAGLVVGSAGGDGLFVCATGAESCGPPGFGNNGLEIGNAETHGIRVQSTGLDGLAVVGAGRYGVNVSGNTLAGYFDGGIQVVNGSCTGCRLAAFARNSGATTLRPGDIVALHSLATSILDSTPLLMEVGRAGHGAPLVGVVEGWAELAPVEDVRPDESGQRLVPRQGPAEPGQYVTIIIYGLAQVRASAVDQPLAQGDRVAVNAGGAGRALRSLEFDGMELAENAPTIGVALERLEAGLEGLIWVLVNPR